MENLDDFVLSKSLKSNYASLNLPHVQAWNKMIQRGDENIPTIGSRMPFIVVVDKAGCGGKKSKSKLYERTEHPSYVKSQKLKVDRQYYVETLQNPLCKLLQFVVDEQILKGIFKEAIEKAALKASNIQSLSGFKIKREENLLGQELSTTQKTIDQESIVNYDNDEFLSNKKPKIQQKSLKVINKKKLTKSISKNLLNFL
jgi:hypothetical protein